MEEKAQRFNIFVKNMEIIDSLNKLNDGVEYGITRYAAHTTEEFKNLFPGFGNPANGGHASIDLCQSEETAPVIPVDNLPASFDWTTKEGVVSPVKDQGSCGTFAASFYLFVIISSFCILYLTSNSIL